MYPSNPENFCEDMLFVFGNNAVSLMYLKYLELLKMPEDMKDITSRVDMAKALYKALKGYNLLYEEVPPVFEKDYDLFTHYLLWVYHGPFVTQNIQDFLLSGHFQGPKSYNFYCLGSRSFLEVEGPFTLKVPEDPQVIETYTNLDEALTRVQSYLHNFTPKDMCDEIEISETLILDFDGFFSLQSVPSKKWPVKLSLATGMPYGWGATPTPYVRLGLRDMSFGDIYKELLLL
jgi:hypothetical protein